MDVQWSMIWSHSAVVATGSQSRCDAFADPLEHADWEGLDWAIPLVSRLVQGMRPSQQSRRKIKEVERFTGVPPARGVCVS